MGKWVREETVCEHSEGGGERVSGGETMCEYSEGGGG